MATTITPHISSAGGEIIQSVVTILSKIMSPTTQNHHNYHYHWKPRNWFQSGNSSCLYGVRRCSSKPKFTSLSPFDCTIILNSCSTPPRNHIYSFSATEYKAVEANGMEALKLTYICPSTSSAAAGYLFIQKKTLKPCSNYWGLNQVTIKYCYPLLLVPDVLKQLKEVHIFTKLNLSAYNLISIHECEWKMALSATADHFEYCFMPHRLSNAPSFFHALINEKCQFHVSHLFCFMIYPQYAQDTQDPQERWSNYGQS